MSQWAEVRHLHLVEGVPKKEIARRLKLDVKTVRRAIGRPTPPVRVSPQRVRSLDPWRKQIEEWLHDDPRLTAKRVRRLLLPLAGPVSQRTVRRYVAALKSEVKTKEAFVHRSALPGATMEVDFGETWVDLAGAPCKVKYLVATLPYSNAYFAKAYPIERLESLLDGIESAFLYFGGATARVVLDNTSLAVKEILAGRDRVQTEAFEAFRGAYPFRAEFCAPAKGWEKGSVEGGVKYARNLVFRPRLAIKSWAALNAAILTELEADLPLRHLDDGRSAQEALALERQHLRALPEHLPATCRVVARVADKFGHVRVDHVTYSVPIRHAYRPAWVKLYHDRVVIAVGAEVVAQHRRVFCRGAKVLDAFHVLPLLERKHLAVAEATALADWRLAPVWEQVRAELAKHTRKPDQEWVRMLRLMETHPAAAVERAVAAALEQHSPRLETVRLILRRRWRPMTRWWEGAADGDAVCRAPASGDGPEDAVPVDDHGAVAAAGRAGHPPASGAGRLLGAVGPSGGDRTPGAPHPTPHSGCPLPDAEDARRLLLRGAAGSGPRRGPAGLRLQLRRRRRQRRVRRLRRPRVIVPTSLRAYIFRGSWRKPPVTGPCSKSCWAFSMASTEITQGAPLQA